MARAGIHRLVARAIVSASLAIAACASPAPVAAPVTNLPAVLRVRIDDVRGDTFVATIFVRQGDRTIELDARPSDAIALALGNGAPILVSRRLLERAGVKREDIERGGPAAGGDAGLIVP